MEQNINQQKIAVPLKWLKKIMQDVYDMRQSQKDYFSQPTAYKLKVAKAKEQQVDVTLHHATQAGYVTPIKNEPINQTDLFHEDSNK